MIEYLRSGESKVGYLNNSVERNMIHRETEVKFEETGPVESVVVEDVPGELWSRSRRVQILEEKRRRILS